MDALNSVSVLWYRKSKPLGKVRRRLQDLRIPSSSYEFIASRPTLDLSHNESARLAADSLLSQGLEGYREVLRAEGEVDFLSEPEKNYILENRRDSNTDTPGEPHDDDKELESLSAASQSPTWCSEVSTDSDDTLAESDQCHLKDVTSRGPVLGEHRIEVFFPSDCRAANMKDLVRQFIRKAKLALAIVMDSFTDVELLCDLLEASRKRNVSVHLLLDRLNLNLFVNMWQDLKLNSKNFPKLSVHSVYGQTYCAKTGRKVKGQIAESFIITDWTEVLTGSYSFSWLSWQVHRSLAVLLKGSAVTSFLQEFHRLHSSSKPVTGFVTFITLPQTLCRHSTSCAAHHNSTAINKQKSKQTGLHWAWNKNAENTQTKAAGTVLLNPQSPEPGIIREDKPQHRADSGSQTQRKPLQLYSKPLVQPGMEHKVQSASVEKPKYTMGAGCTKLDEKEKSQDQIQSHSYPPDQTYFSHIPSQFNISATAENNAKVQESNPLHMVSLTHGQHRTARYQTALKNSNLGHADVTTEGRFLPTNPLGTAADLNAQKGQWSSSHNFKPKVELPHENPKPHSPTSQQKQADTTHLLPFTPPRGHTPDLQNKFSFLETRRQGQPQRYCQPPLQSQTSTEPPGPMRGHLRPQLQKDPKLFLPGKAAQMHLQSHSSQQLNPPPRLNRTLWKHHTAGRPTAVERHSSFRTTYGMGQMTGGQHGWRPLQSSMNEPLRRSKSMNERHTAGFNLNRTFT
ncbi:protein FAM83H [Archocentrus centrarchus]|uniref:protein FAM83H n=1 Tax=Archocentrus centrarchus TaxID=63155 RepID=UPI0011E9D96A|nr:protein FAM83A [Archocentrus centrarchus]